MPGLQSYLLRCYMWIARISSGNVLGSVPMERKLSGEAGKKQLTADLHHLPPILIQVGGDELLLDDVIRFSECFKEAGVDLTLQVWPHMWHVWHICASRMPEANQTLEHIAIFIHNHLRLS